MTFDTACSIVCVAAAVLVVRIWLEMENNR